MMAKGNWWQERLVGGSCTEGNGFNSHLTSYPSKQAKGSAVCGSGTKVLAVPRCRESVGAVGTPAKSRGLPANKEVRE